MVSTSTSSDPENVLREQLESGRKLANPAPGEEIVISGLSGLYPDSCDVNHFRDNLFGKVDLVNERNIRWSPDLPDLPGRIGNVPNLEKFDAPFFGMHREQADCADPACRVMLEKAVECLMDAGVNPTALKGSNTGIFLGVCMSETEYVSFFLRQGSRGYALTNGTRPAFARRLSYYLGTNGPAYVMDSACSSSLLALDAAYKSIRDGHCDAALVGTSNLCLAPKITTCFLLLGVLSPNGMCKPLDEDANGYARAETVSMVYLQKAKDAKRIYATLVHSKANCDGYKTEGITFPSSNVQARLMSEVYAECGVDPLQLSYLEVHGTGTKVGDPEELDAISTVFCNGRPTPLPIGSVKSNMGHSEPSSGLCGLTKVIIAIETGNIPPNIHCENPKQSIEAIRSGKVKIIMDKTPWTPGYVGINSFGFGGGNCHVLVKPNPKRKVIGDSQRDTLPLLVAVSGRTEEAVNVILDELANQKPADREFARLLHDVFDKPIPGHNHRGFVVLNNNGDHVRDVQPYLEAERPVWFVFPGFGCQWSAMARDLLQVPVFAASIQRCHEVLRPVGLDLKHILANKDNRMFQDVINLSVGIVAVQIAIVDVLTSVGITADGIVGYSVGEISCAYADGCFDTEQAMLVAYWRGVSCKEMVTTEGAMAKVGLAPEEVRKLEEDIDIACFDSNRQCSISGALKDVQRTVDALKVRGVFESEIECGNVPVHSRFVRDAKNKLTKYLEKVILQPKTRSAKWISSSVTEDNWSTSLGRFSSAEYHANNLLSPVLFQNTVQKIPKNAIVIDISPSAQLHDAFSTMIRNGRYAHVELRRRQETDGAAFFLSAVGRLFQLGQQPHIHKMYPEVEFPVSRSTPMIGPLIKWDHEVDRFLISYDELAATSTGHTTVTIDMNSSENQYLIGHTIDGRNLFPASGYLCLVWDALARLHVGMKEKLSVVFENVRFMRATNLPADGKVTFTVLVQKVSGSFEVAEGGSPIVTGVIRKLDNPETEMADLPPAPQSKNSSQLELKTKDIYKELRLRGYNYSGCFRGIVSADTQGLQGKVKWIGNWVAFIDNMLQMQVLHSDSRGLGVPTALEKVVIDVPKHERMILESGMDGVEDTELLIRLCPEARIMQSGGVEVRSLVASVIPRRKRLADPVLEKYQFVPYFSPITTPLQTALQICIHILLENSNALTVPIAEVVDTPVTRDWPVLAPLVTAILGDLPLVQPKITVFTPPGPHSEDLESSITVEDGDLKGGEDFLLLIASDILIKPEKLQTAANSLADDGWIITREKASLSDKDMFIMDLKKVFDRVVHDERIVLLRKVKKTSSLAVVQITEKDFSWLPTLQAAIPNRDFDKVLLVAQNEPENGIIGLINCVNKEPGGRKVRCFFILDPRAPPFDSEHPFYKTQLAHDLTTNVYLDGEWGSYRHLPLEESPSGLVHHRVANVTIPGDLSSYRWLEGPLIPEKCDQSTKDKLVHVYYSALNFRDVMTATGKLQAEVVDSDRRNLGCVQGFEFSGRGVHGQRLMGMAHYGALANMVVALKNFVWPVPDHWSLEDAATVPVVYATAYYALNFMGQMRRGESILIHSGTGGVGQAAINLCLHEGLTVYTTVGTQEKRDFIREHYPQIPDKHVLNSRDTSFEQRVMEETNGRGVDLVLNSLAEEKLLASVRCLAKGGRFLEIGKFDLANNNPLGMECFLNECSYNAVMLDCVMKSAPELGRVIYERLTDGIKSGAVRPLPRTVFAEGDIEKAYRYMTTGKHIGKVLINMRPEEPQPVVVPVPKMLPADSRFFCNPQCSYVIVGGLGGFGLELADWLVLRGAQKLVLTSRRGVTTGYQTLRIQTWQSYGAKVEVSTEDVTSQTGVEALLKRARALGPVDGIFNLAVVLQDALLTNQTEERFAISAAPKALATRLLDAASRHLCPHMRHFVVFSSVSCGRGNAGQSNYGMSNSVMERICERRRAEGLPGLAIQWGAVGEVGLVAEMQEEQHEIDIGGTLQQTIASCLSVMDRFLRQKHPVVSSMVVAEKRMLGSTATTVVGCVAEIIGIRNMETVNLHATLAEIGMDSMMAVEIVQTLEREFEIFLTPQDVRTMTFSKLHEIQVPASNGDEDAKTVALTSGRDEAIINMLLRVVGKESASRGAVVTMASRGRKPTIFMVPGLEGMSSVLEPLACNIPARVLCLQPPITDKLFSLEELAQHLLQHMTSDVTVDPFLLVGYSFGGVLALEMAMAMESQGRKGRLVLIDSSPDSIKTAVASWAQDKNEMLQVNILVTILMLIVPEQYFANKDTLLSKLQQASTWEARLDHVLQEIPTTVFSATYAKQLITTIYYRVMATNVYQWTHSRRLRSPVLLVRPTEMMLDTGSDDFGLGKICENLEVSRRLEGDHVTVLENPEVAESVAEFLLKDHCQ